MHLDRLRPVFDRPGPYLTVHVDVGRASEHADSQIDARWTTIRHDLEHAGVDGSLVEEIGTRLRAKTHLPGEVRRTIVAAGDEVLLDDLQEGHNPHPEVVDRAELPDLASWLDQEDQAFPFIVVVADRTGADIDVYRAASRPSEEHESVTGETFYITKVAEGDWAQKQFQQTAQESWEHNARLVSEAVLPLVRRTRALAVFVVGEVRARAEVVRALEATDHGLGDRIVPIESGGRAEGSSDQAMWGEIHEHLRAHVAAEDADTTAALEQSRGRGEGAATGLDDVLEALAKGQVDRLLVDLDAVREKSVTPSQHPGLTLPDNAASASELPADRVLVAAGALTGARLTVLPASMARGGGASALLRWAN
jgi:hypothetical protein